MAVRRRGLRGRKASRGPGFALERRGPPSLAGSLTRWLNKQGGPCCCEREPVEVLYLSGKRGGYGEDSRELHDYVWVTGLLMQG